MAQPQTGQITCKQCNATFTTDSELKEHERKQHQGSTFQDQKSQGDQHDSTSGQASKDSGSSGQSGPR